MEYQQLQDEIKAAMKARDNHRRDILRQVHTELKAIEVNERRDVTEADVDAMLKRVIKQTKETLDGSIKAGNNQERTDTLTEQVRIARWRRVTSKNRTTYQLVFDRTPFYGNSGGQIGDTGFIDNGSERIAVVATEKENGLIIHITERLPEDLAAVFRAQVDPARRQSAANNHTATHLLDYALKQVLGEHVEQKGSMVTPDYLRFDFSHFQKVTPEQLREVEKKVNAMIRSNHPLVERRDATIEQAREAGAIMLFGEKYGDRVRMVTFGPSTELCGGTHTSATGTIGLFKIVSESAISAGVRRIEAVTGEGAERILYTVQDTMQSIEQMLHSPRLVQTIEKILEGNDALSRELDEMRREKIVELADKIVAEASCTHDVLLIARRSEYKTDFLKDLAYALRQRSDRLVLVMGNVVDGKATLSVMLSDAIVERGVDAGAVVREAAKLIGGGGGGQKFYATAGGKNPDGVQAAIDRAVEMIMEKLN